MPRFTFICISLVVLSTSASVPTANAVDAVNASDRESLRKAIQIALPMLEKGARGTAEQRTCFTCHSQALPVMALREARAIGLDIDEENFTNQVKHTLKHLQRGKSNFAKGKGQGGQVVSAGYALWTLEAAEHPSDETTSAVVHYLLERQKNQPYWSQPSKRPPTSGSQFTNSYLAMRALRHFGNEAHEPRIAARADKLKKWLLSTQPKDNEDRVFRLRLMEYLDIEDSIRSQAKLNLLEKQREDGGWGQTDEMESDVYATATAVVALLRASAEPSEKPLQRAIQYLLDHQLEDGTWHVVTRADGFQKYFESGFPHGKDQFISTAASSWAVIALCLAID